MIVSPDLIILGAEPSKDLERRLKIILVLKPLVNTAELTKSCGYYRCRPPRPLTVKGIGTIKEHFLFN